MLLSNQTSALSARKWEERKIGEGWIITRRMVGLWSTCSPQDICLPFVSKPGGIWASSLQVQSPGGGDHLECLLQLPQPGLEKAPEGEASLPHLCYVSDSE